MTAQPPLYAVLGGMHLSGPSEQFINATVDALAALDFSLIAPAHCTGWNAEVALSERLAEASPPNAVGATFEL